MKASKSITQKRYSLVNAIMSVPAYAVKDVRKDVMKILGITTRSQLNRISTGECPPTLPKAKAVEEYFLNKYGITEVWKEESPLLDKALKQAEVTKF